LIHRLRGSSPTSRIVTIRKVVEMAGAKPVQEGNFP